jgi:hypothetical protein
MKAVAGELVKIAKELTAGTWDLPGSPSKVATLVQVIRLLKNGEWPTKTRTNPVVDMLGSLLGDDSLFDSLDEAGRIYLKECAEYIESTIKKLAKQPADSFKNPRDYAGLQEVLKHL